MVTGDGFIFCYELCKMHLLYENQTQMVKSLVKNVSKLFTNRKNDVK